MARPPTSTPPIPAWLLPAAALLAFLAQWPLVANPGYFSHDELQWAARAWSADGGPLPWMAWTDPGVFQYRPLTFNLWLWLSRHLFDTPMAFHAVLVAMGALNTALLAGLLRRLGAAPAMALIGALGFALGPYATYVHGWVGTIGDLLWVAMALACGWVCSTSSSTLPGARRPRQAAVAIGCALLTAIGLLAKEAALSIPALLAVAALLDRERPGWRWGLLGSALPAAAYLALRIGVLGAAGEGSGAYAWSIERIPVRALEYFVFLPQFGAFETLSALVRGFADPSVWVAIALWLVVLAALARTGWRAPAALVGGGLAALGPVLVLPTAYNQYGYGFAAVVAGVFALAWPRLPRWGRAATGLLAVLVLWHGIHVMRWMHRVGEVQAVFTPALVEAVRDRDPARPLRLRVAADAKAWMFMRLTHEIPHVRGEPIGGRVVLVDGDVEGDAAADAVVRADGRIEPLPAPDR
ncbi:hypothetical protein [Marilutibacter maris]|uniref:Glycosyltransferase RgtA/B/C/D-like domain-containing protein n=1 Tax=Marilutibacter maris TaxID=1605891 RepID=A0A2U9TDS5_9GAMM|nr:hypothetical protein [Lysobacter maris]AWV08638.1 hypothetical protein C9I47_2969 [Lysobacter maris]